MTNINTNQRKTFENKNERYSKNLQISSQIKSD